MTKVKVLFLAANPVGATQLQLNEEIRTITAKIRAADYRDSLEIIPCFAVRADDLLQALLEHKPQIVHFSGHGSAAGELIVVDDSGQPKAISKEAIVQLFGTLKDNIRVILLNACYSRIQADAMASIIDCTVGMDKAISDNAATLFAASFYRAIGFGRSLQEAFDIGKTALLLEGLPEHSTPELVVRVGVNPSNVVLVGTRPSEGPLNPIIQPFWRFLDDDLQDVFALAATAAQRAGKNYVSTTTFVEAMLRLNPGRLPDFFHQLPVGALPEATPANIPVDLSSLDSLGSLSPCINSAMSNLTREITPKDKLSSEDVYIDIARYGTGKSTMRLRNHGVSKAAVEKIVGQLGWQLIERTTNTAE